MNHSRQTFNKTVLGAFLFLLMILTTPVISRAAENPKRLQKEGKTIFTSGIMEMTPVFWHGEAVLLVSQRPPVESHSPQDLSLAIFQIDSGKKIAEFGAGHSLACAYVEKDPNGDIFHVYAAKQPEGETWFRSIDHLWSRDLVHWRAETALPAEEENLLNSSVTKTDNQYLIAYESNQPVSFCFKFALSHDLKHWKKVSNLFYAGKDRQSYSACPVIRWHAPYYYVIYLRQAADGNGFESALIRSKDLEQWEESPMNPILHADEGEGINNSDVDLFERDGKVWLYYAVGDQKSWSEVRRAFFEGTEKEFFQTYFPQ